MLLEQSFNFLVRTYKDKEDEKKDYSLSTAYKRKKLACCSDNCRVDELCQEIWEDEQYQLIVKNYMDLKTKNAKLEKPSVNLEKVAETLKEIKLGKRQVRDCESTLELCGEMFNAGYAEALSRACDHKPSNN